MLAEFEGIDVRDLEDDAEMELVRENEGVSVAVAKKLVSVRDADWPKEVEAEGE